MKITLCAYDAPNNIDGPTTWLKRLLPYLREHGVETRILFLATNVKNLTTLAYFRKLGFLCKLIPAELFFEEQMQMIIKDIVEYTPDVFIPNYFPVAGYVNRYTKKAGIPSVIILHNDDAKHRALVEEFGKIPKENSVSCVVSVSKLLQKDMVAMELPNVRMECIPYGAPVPATTTTWDGQQTLKLIYLGRFDNHQKRIIEVTKALFRVTKELPDVEAVMYGNGPSLKEVQDIIKSEGKGGKVKYGGVLKINETQNKLLENHVFVLLSEYEGIPISLMEAMACGLVPVCSNIKSGITELLENEVNGLIVEDRNDAFVKAVTELAVDSKKWKMLSNAARSTINGEYADDVCNNQWLVLLKDIAEENTFKGSLKIPPIGQLKKIKVSEKFLLTETRHPHPVILPVYRLKKALGRLKRNYSN